MSRRRVVVTGMGMLSPLGVDVAQSWSGILAGKSGIGLIEHMNVDAFSTRFGGSVKNFDVEQYMPAKDARRLDLFIQYGLAAGMQAMTDSGLEVTDANRQRIGVAMGSGIGGLTNIENTSKTLFDQGPRRISPFLPMMPIAFTIWLTIPESRKIYCAPVRKPGIPTGSTCLVQRPKLLFPAPGSGSWQQVQPTLLIFPSSSEPRSSDLTRLNSCAM